MTDLDNVVAGAINTWFEHYFLAPETTYVLSAMVILLTLYTAYIVWKEIRDTAERLKNRKKANKRRRKR